MRTYGRITNEDGTRTWVQVQSDAAGNDDLVWFTTLLQVLQLQPGESPFFANYGIPAYRSVMTQVLPDYYVALTQKQFAPYFASLIVARLSGGTEPTYSVAAVTHAGVRLSGSIPAS